MSMYPADPTGSGAIYYDYQPLQQQAQQQAQQQVQAQVQAQPGHLQQHPSPSRYYQQQPPPVLQHHQHQQHQYYQPQPPQLQPQQLQQLQPGIGLQQAPQQPQQVAQQPPQVQVQVQQAQQHAQQQAQQQAQTPLSQPMPQHLAQPGFVNYHHALGAALGSMPPGQIATSSPVSLSPVTGSNFDGSAGVNANTNTGHYAPSMMIPFGVPSGPPTAPGSRGPPYPYAPAAGAGGYQYYNYNNYRYSAPHLPLAGGAGVPPQQRLSVGAGTNSGTSTPYSLGGGPDSPVPSPTLWNGAGNSNLLNSMNNQMPLNAATRNAQLVVTDPEGQIAPPNAKPKVTTTLWEDESTLCFQVEARGICVARREDNDMINGTKLLNVAGMTRGRRDGILKLEKQRHVVKAGAMHLKGVWISYDRALDLANRERITDLLYPLFVKDIRAVLYHPANYAKTADVLNAAEKRKREREREELEQKQKLEGDQQKPESQEQQVEGDSATSGNTDENNASSEPASAAANVNRDSHDSHDHQDDPANASSSSNPSSSSGSGSSSNTERNANNTSNSTNSSSVPEAGDRHADSVEHKHEPLDSQSTSTPTLSVETAGTSVGTSSTSTGTSGGTSTLSNSSLSSLSTPSTISDYTHSTTPMTDSVSPTPVNTNTNTNTNVKAGTSAGAGYRLKDLSGLAIMNHPDAKLLNSNGAPVTATTTTMYHHHQEAGEIRSTYM